MGHAAQKPETTAAPAVSIRALSRSDRETMLGMYRCFEPLGAAQGLPPVSEQGRGDWIDTMLAESENFGAFDERGEFIGHVILAPSGPAEMEAAFFVHQNFRRRRVGTKLLRCALAHAAAQGVRRLWASVTSDNVPSLRLLRGQGFKAASFTVPSLELELLLGKVESDRPEQRNSPYGGNASGGSDAGSKPCFPRISCEMHRQRYPDGLAGASPFSNRRTWGRKSIPKSSN